MLKRIPRMTNLDKPYAKGASINDVYKISAIFDPPPPLCLLFVVIWLTPLYNYVFQPRPPPLEDF